MRSIKKGESVGYGTNFCASEDMRVAVLALGYEEVLPYSINNAVVYFEDKDLSLIGKPCMDTCFIDATGVEIQEGDEVVIFENESQLNKLAYSAGTISYEILTRMSNRIHRVYLD